MMRPMGTAVEDQLELVRAERAISRVLHSYSRGADRCDLELMRSCYWPDGTDDHGSYNGGVDRFERRGGEWRIAARVCAFEWRRTDPVPAAGSSFADTYTRGLRGPDDIVWHILD